MMLKEVKNENRNYRWNRIHRQPPNNRLASEGHEIVSIDRRHQSNEGVRSISCGLSDVSRLIDSFKGCDTVAHCAGINREIGNQNYQRVHVEGTRNVVEAAKATGVKKILLMSFLRARPILWFSIS
jgi:NADH dehydrogenase